MKAVKIIQLPEEQWQEVYIPTALTVLPFTHEELKKLYKLDFEEDFDNLGLTKFCVIEVKGHMLWLQSHPEGPEANRKVAVYMRSYETNPKTVLKAVKKAFGVTKKELAWIQPNLSSPSWAVVRTDSDGSQEEVYRFQEKQIAESVAERFAMKAYSQYYAVKEIAA